ncbi:hypothetical protein [Salinactinospora qingdaonensis]|uniref:Uncharacterized protein n=1 Tax=Salinactinospora qingdaonensis TaxID=702744 RepID=A0ABP7G9C4_9ACTN
MEAWLNCDKTIIIDKALRRYRLAWHDILAHAVLQTPARPCKRARLMRGPWRYSRYDIRVFLITTEGVREVSIELDFENATFKSQERNNFRFEAVSSVHLSETDEFSYTLNLTLMNGPVKEIAVTKPEPQDHNSDETPSELSEINLDAAGFAHTRHILEGIAAEGKTWIDRYRTAGASDERSPTAARG